MFDHFFENKNFDELFEKECGYSIFKEDNIQSDEELTKRERAKFWKTIRRAEQKGTGFKKISNNKEMFYRGVIYQDWVNFQSKNKTIEDVEEEYLKALQTNYRIIEYGWGNGIPKIFKDNVFYAIMETA